MGAGEINASYLLSAFLSLGVVISLELYQSCVEVFIYFSRTPAVSFLKTRRCYKLRLYKKINNNGSLDVSQFDRQARVFRSYLGLKLG